MQDNESGSIPSHSRNKMCYENEAQSLINRAKSTSKSLLAGLPRFTAANPSIVFSAMTGSARPALEAASVNGLPITGVLHSIELERANFDLREVFLSRSNPGRENL
jgi:hypothetical protein